MHTGYKHNFYNDKQDIVDGLFDQYHTPLLKFIDHPELIQEWKQNLYAAAYGRN